MPSVIAECTNKPLLLNVILLSVMAPIEVRLHWRDFAGNFVQACPFSNENKIFFVTKRASLMRNRVRKSQM